MKKMLKIMAMLLVIATVVFAAGCAEQAEETEGADEAVEEPSLAGEEQTSGGAEGNQTPAENVTDNVTDNVTNVTANVTANVTDNVSLNKTVRSAETEEDENVTETEEE